MSIYQYNNVTHYISFLFPKSLSSSSPYKEPPKTRDRDHHTHQNLSLSDHFSFFLSAKMGSKHETMGVTNTWGLAVVAVLVVLNNIGFVRSTSLDEDRAQCADKLVGLATCLPYVGGEAKSPTLDCCSGLKTVVEKSKKCLCVLLKDRNDPNLGINLNSTLALQLPTSCHVPTNISKCVELLHLAPNSSDAKMFEGYANSHGKSSSGSLAPISSENSTSNGSTIGNDKSESGKGKGLMGMEIIMGTILFFCPHLVLYI
ncbi:non-specific lipid transfer protein GPI-anchored 14-like [Humulus lupulus]|uniref:non-specific lipid transfer protein GPI-anchored 14-like n=1 Tax=Humulus lupulus TaxID=3486 RepID=UPI002B409056|nr:non-specific lipid transfer protein GPI-anchored 14-like [Humulus lupulus]